MGTVVGSWRLKTLVSLFIILTLVYTINGFFFDVETNEQGYVTSEQITISQNQTEEAEDVSNDFVDMLYGIGSYLTFGNIDNSYARIILNLLTSVCWIIIGYLLYTFIKEFIPFV